MIETLSDVRVIRVFSDINPLIDCAVIVDSIDYNRAYEVVDSEIERIWQLDDYTAAQTYGDMISNALNDAGIDFEIFFGEPLE